MNVLNTRGINSILSFVVENCHYLPSSGIGRLPETTESRSIRIEIKKKKSNETTRKFSVYELDEFEGTKQKCLRFAMDNIDLLKSVSPKFPEGIEDRDGDNWRPLLGISEIAGKDWP